MTKSGVQASDDVVSNSVPGTYLAYNTAVPVLALVRVYESSERETVLPQARHVLLQQ